MKKFLNHDDSELRQVGITLLTWSEYPIEDTTSKNLLLKGLKNSKTWDEDQAWSRLLDHIEISEENQKL